MIASPNLEHLPLLAPSQAPDELGRLGPYRVLEVLGSGGMGVVFRAEDPQLRRPVALKALLGSLAACPQARQRFLREARAAAAVEHDHVVPIWQVGEDRGVPFIAMPLLRGESLDRRLERERKLPLAEVLRIGRQAAHGLAAAHARGLVHCDVKPSNLWLEGADGRARLLDFGLARALGDAGDTESVSGTPYFMAPEQARGDEVDGRADLFSLGCVLYRMATGELPFVGSDSIATLIVAAVDEPTPPAQLDPALPPAFSELVLHLLAKSPEQRPSSAAVTARALEAIEQGLAVASAGAGPRSRRRWPSPAFVATVALCGVLVLLLAPPRVRTAAERDEPPAPPVVVPADRGAVPDRISPASAPGPAQTAGLRADAGDLTIARRGMGAPVSGLSGASVPQVPRAWRSLEQQRDAVGFELLRTEAQLSALDARLRARPAPPELPLALDRDAEARRLRAQAQKAQGAVDAYRARGIDLSLPGPAVAARELAWARARLAQRSEEIADQLRAASGQAEGREELRRARRGLVDRLAELRQTHTALQGELELLRASSRRTDVNPSQPAAGTD